MSSTVSLRYSRNYARGGTHALLLGFVAPGTKVLDVGCATGYLGEALLDRGCQVWGVERDSSAARVAARLYDGVAEIDLDDATELPWDRASFDVVLAADVLEHLRDARRALRLLRTYARPGATFILSLPNVAHASIRLALLFGRFRYTESGILDRTHCSLFTFATARQLVDSSGLRVEHVFGGSDRFGRVLALPAVGNTLRGLLAYNIVLVAREPDDG